VIYVKFKENSFMKERYINPFTDFGFKKLFGEEANKDLLIDFLNELLEDRGGLTDLTFIKSEQLGATEADRKAIFDLYCQNSKGEKFIVELQKAKQKFFKDRSIYYSTFPIQEQALKGDWDYKLNAVYTISIMDFEFDDNQLHKAKIRHDIQLLDIETKELFYDKLKFIYLEMPKFNKTIDELETHYDKWLYVLKNLPKLDRVPEKLKEGLFLRLFEVAEIAKYDDNEQRAYQDSVKYYRDLKNVMDTAVEEAMTNRNIEITRNLIKEGADDVFISKITGLAIEQIRLIRLNV
jgi:predicted transposase/invertase (TIGR01784 family)